MYAYTHIDKYLHKYIYIYISTRTKIRIMATFLMRRKKSKVENAYNLEQSALELTPYEYYSFWKNIMSPTKEQSDTGPKFMKAIIEKILLLENETAKKKQDVQQTHDPNSFRLDWHRFGRKIAHPTLNCLRNQKTAGR